MARYRTVCGFSPAQLRLPATYPHVLAFPLHLALMTDARLPVSGDGRGAHRQHDPTAPADRRPTTCSTSRSASPTCARTAAVVRSRCHSVAQVDGEISLGERDRRPPSGGDAGRRERRCRRRGSRLRPARASRRPDHSSGGCPSESRPLVRRGLRRPQPDPPVRRDRAATRVSATTSPTACGPRPAAWPSSATGLPDAFERVGGLQEADQPARVRCVFGARHATHDDLSDRLRPHVAQRHAASARPDPARSGELNRSGSTQRGRPKRIVVDPVGPEPLLERRRRASPRRRGRRSRRRSSRRRRAAIVAGAERRPSSRSRPASPG